jgi:uncharacterized FAD-dependent dehydrogenase
VPGRQVVAATSEEGRVVTNGMSQYSRAERNANSGMVVSINPEDYPGGAWPASPSSALESHAYVLGGSTYEARPLVGDFLAGRASTAVGSVEPSYQPGVHWTDLAPRCRILPYRHARSLPEFGKKIRGYDMRRRADRVETRTSSPLRITRGEDLQSLNVKGLYPAGAVTRAVFCLPGWMASAWLRRWRWR